MTVLTENEVEQLQLDCVAKDRVLIMSSHENLRNLLKEAAKLIEAIDKELYMIQGYELEPDLPPKCQMAHDFRMKLRKAGFVYEDPKGRRSVADQGKPPGGDGK
jgi:hypothetical protein